MGLDVPDGGRECDDGRERDEDREPDRIDDPAARIDVRVGVPISHGQLLQPT